ncbi:Uncharacterised protein [Vibrio cholerae]|nr:Uncharacterised protein [Vibrio cholerae]
MKSTLKASLKKCGRSGETHRTFPAEGIAALRGSGA